MLIAKKEESRRNIKSIDQCLKEDINEFLDDYYTYKELMTKDEFERMINGWVDDLYLLSAKLLKEYNINYTIKDYDKHQKLVALNLSKDELELEMMGAYVLKEYQQLKEWTMHMTRRETYLIEFVHPELRDKTVNMITEQLEFGDVFQNFKRVKCVPASGAELFQQTRPAYLDNVFAYFTDEFTPDPVDFDSIISRWKNRTNLEIAKGFLFNNLVAEYENKISDIYYDEHPFGLGFSEIDKFKKMEVLKSLLNYYMINGFKTHQVYKMDQELFKLSLTEKDKELAIKVEFYLRGVEAKEKVKKKVFESAINEPDVLNTKVVKKLVLNLVRDIKLEISGQEARKNQIRVEGEYPRKDHYTTGLRPRENGHLDGFTDKQIIELNKMQSIYLVRRSYEVSKHVVVSSSGGNDSVFTLYFVQMIVLPGDIMIVYNVTGLNFGESIQTQYEVCRKYGIPIKNIIRAMHKDNIWNLIEKYGFNFSVKGKRDSNTTGSVSEICCIKLKHEPMIEAINNHNWDLNFTGLRAEESRARDLAAKRDGAIYHASSWGINKCNPITFWLDKHVWMVVKEDEIPYSPIYDMVATWEEIDPKTGETVQKEYRPRTGCWACLLRAKSGYLRWLKQFKPKMYKHLMIDRGLGELLYRLFTGAEVRITEKGGVLSPEIDGEKQLSLFDEEVQKKIETNEISLERLMWFIENRPCHIQNLSKQLS